MEIIKREDVDLGKFRKIECTSNSEASLYRNDYTLYKMYRNVQNKIVQRKMFKLLILNDGELLKNIVIPNTMILDKSLLCGCAMNYINDTVPAQNFTMVSKDIIKFLTLIYNISLSLREIHSDSRDIVVGDLNFNNIIFDKNMNHYFVDFDSVMINGISADRIPVILNSYANRRGKYKFEINQETDRLSMMLSTLYMIFSKPIDCVTMNEYDAKAERLRTLKNMREFVLKVKYSCNGLPDVPYLDELISSSDTILIKKVKTTSVK